MGVVGDRHPTELEQRLIDSVVRGELLDLAGDEPVDEAAMRSWDGPGRTVRAEIIRDVVLGRLAAEPDPRGLRLRGALIAGRIDLENVTRDLNVQLTACHVPDGLLLRDTSLLALDLADSRIGPSSGSDGPTIDAARLTVRLLDLSGTTVTGTADGGAIRLVAAHFDQLTCQGARLRNTGGPALNADGLRVEQDVFLSDGFTATGTGEHGAVRLPGAHFGHLDCTGARLENTTGPALNADSLRVDQAVFLRDGFTATGAGNLGTIRLLGAHIGQLECDGARLENTTGPAMHADSLRVDQAVFLRDGFTATGTGDDGAVRLSAAHIGGQLDCTGARLENTTGPALNAGSMHVGQTTYLVNGFTATGAGGRGVLQLDDAHIGGGLRLDTDRVFTTDPLNRTLVDLDGTVYTGLPRPGSLDRWLRVLREHTPAYAAQPYQQLAAVHRAAGHDHEARDILMAQRRDQIERGAITGTDRAWARITGLTLGFGYQPWRALLLLVGVLLLSVSAAVLAGHDGGLAHTSRTTTPGAACSTLEQIGVGLDVGTPLFKTGTRDQCAPTATTTGQALTIVGWLLQALAWAFAALFIAGFTSAVRRT
ncbi:hypothetical protein ACTI_37690 [Actinoplanes sp. OR16]|uniref:hypothetical protein n=1 Tax=Actinoplanes sp. OR16 TaxID=946334 RepID=UPI000F6B5459|nr:hypothetical protein [Actinoplanes sp. OR16]BBH67084.1 hypothetical protein ACTI_37690 [Actinoplanes sp. OR16]